MSLVLVNFLSLTTMENVLISINYSQQLISIRESIGTVLSFPDGFTLIMHVGYFTRVTSRFILNLPGYKILFTSFTHYFGIVFETLIRGTCMYTWTVHSYKRNLISCSEVV